MRSYHISKQVILECILDEDLEKEAYDPEGFLARFKSEGNKYILKHEKLPNKLGDLIR